MRQDPIEILTLEISELKNRVEALERGTSATPPPKPYSPPSTSPTSPQSSVEQHEELPSSTNTTAFVMGVIAIICFALGGIYLISLSIESGWLTPLRQVALAATLGLTLTAMGCRAASITGSAYGGFLASAGFIVLQACCFGSHLYWQMTSAPLAIILTIGVSLGAIIVAQTIREDIVAAIGVLGVYAIPLLMPVPGGHDFIAFSLLCWAVVVSLVAAATGQRAALLLSSYFAVPLLSYAIANGSSIRLLPLETLHDLALYQALQFLVFMVGHTAVSIQSGKPLSKGEVYLGIPLVIWFFGIENAALARFCSPGETSSLMLAASALLWIIALVASRNLHQASAGQIVAELFTALTLGYNVYTKLLPSDVTAVTPFIGAMLLLAATRLLRFGLQSYALQLLVLLVWSVELGSVLEQLCTTRDEVPYRAVALGILHAAVLLTASYLPSSGLKGNAKLVSSIGHSTALCVIYALSHHHGSIAISTGWSLYAGGVLWISWITRQAFVAYSSLTVILVILAKVFFVDVANATSGARIVTLLLAGCLGLGAGVLFKKIASWEVKS